MTLRETMARHARTTLVRVDHFGETVGYVPKAGGTPVTFLAVVDRLGNRPVQPGVPQAAKLRLQVFIPRDATRGVLAIAKGDTLLLPKRIGETPAECRIAEIITEDEGAFVVECHG